MTNKVSDKIIRIVDQIVDNRSNFDELNESIAEFFSPYKKCFNFENNLSSFKQYIYPENDNIKRSNSIVFHYLENFIVFVLDLLASQNTSWFRIVPDLDSLKTNIDFINNELSINQTNYLQNAQYYLEDYLSKINFYKYLALSLGDAITYGYGVMFLEVPYKNKKNFDSYFIYAEPETLYFSLDALGEIEYIVRKFELSDEQIVSFFDEEDDKIPKFLNKDNLDNSNTIIQFIYCDKERKNNKKDKKYISIYYRESDRFVLREKILDYIPFFPLRWIQKGNFNYSFGQTLLVLEEVKNLNLISSCDRGMILDNYMPSIAYDERMFKGKFNPTTLNGGYLVSFNPAYTYRNINAPFIKLKPQVDFRKPMIDYERLLEIIKSVFYADLIQLRAGTKTATEVARLNIDMMRFLQPLVSQIYNETIKPILNTILNGLIISGKIANPSSQGFNGLKFNFISQPIIAQKQQELEKLLQFGNMMGSFGQVTQNPVFSIAINEYVLINKIADDLNIDRSLIRSEEEILEILNQTREMQERSQNIDNLEKGSKAVENFSNATKNLV